MMGMVRRVAQICSVVMAMLMVGVVKGFIAVVSIVYVSLSIP